MSRDEELRGIAIALKKESLYFSGGWNINILQAFIRDGGCCVYCGKEVLKEFSLAFCGDHERDLQAREEPHLSLHASLSMLPCRGFVFRLYALYILQEVWM